MTKKNKKIRAAKRNAERAAANSAIANGAILSNYSRDSWNEIVHVEETIRKMLQSGTFSSYKEEITWIKNLKIPGAILEGEWSFRNMFYNYEYISYGVANIPMYVKMTYRFRFSSDENLIAEIASQKGYFISHSNAEKEKLWKESANCRWVLYKNKFSNCEIKYAYVDRGRFTFQSGESHNPYQCFLGIGITVGGTTIIIRDLVDDNITSEDNLTIFQFGGTKVRSTVYSHDGTRTIGFNIKDGSMEKYVSLESLKDTDGYKEYEACKEAYRNLLRMCFMEHVCKGMNPYDRRMVAAAIKKLGGKN